MGYSARLQVIPVPDFDRETRQARRVIDDNFTRIATIINGAVASGSLIGPGSITIDLLATSVKTFSGDLTGTLPAGTVVGLRGKSLSAPVAGDNGKAITYSSAGSGSFGYTALFTNPLTTRGDLLTQNPAGTNIRLAIGAANRVLFSDGTDPSWNTVTAILDSIGSTQGSVLYRGAASWTALGPGTSGHFLKTLGAGADPAWASTSAGASPLTTKGDIWGYSTVDARIPVGTDGWVLVADSTQTLGVKWAASGSGATNALLDGSNHTDTVAGTVVRGDIVYGNSTPKWDRLAKGAAERILRSDGTDIAWGAMASRFYTTKGHVVYNAQNAQNAIDDDGGLKSGITVQGTRADGGDSTRYCNKYTSATSPVNASAGPGVSITTMPQPQHCIAFRCDFKIVTGTNGVFWAGLTSGSLNSTTSPAFQLAAIRWIDGTDTNFKFVLKDGSTLNPIDTGVAKDANWHDLRIETADAGVTWKCWLDGVEVASSSTNVPTTTTGLGFGIVIALASTGTADEIRNSYVRMMTGPHMFA